MAKSRSKRKHKKKSASGSGRPNAKQYFRSGQARKLPLHTCWVSPTWERDGVSTVIVSRKHKTGNITGACFLVDFFCLGVKDVAPLFNVTEEYFDNIVANMEAPYVQVPYELAHSMVYGSVAYAQQFGIAPHPDFNNTQTVLAPDDDTIALEPVTFGRNGRPCLIPGPSDNKKLPFYLKQLKDAVGVDGFEFMGQELDFGEYDDDDDSYSFFDDGDEEEEDAEWEEEVK